MLKRTIFGLGLSGLLAAAIAAVSAETIQLKEPASATPVSDETSSQEPAAAPEGTSPDAGAAIPGGLDANVQSYSVVTENRVGPDGTRIQKRKVWQNGTLVEEKEEVIEGDGDELSAEMDGETIPGMISRSEQIFGFPGGMSEMFQDLHENLNSMDLNLQGIAPETRQRMEEANAQLQNQLDNMNQRRAEMFRRFGNVAGAAPLALSEYWIGASVSPVSDDMAYQLGLDEGVGLVVREIVPDSPAEKAGLEKYDILLKFGDRQVSTAEEIGGIVDEAAGAPLTVEYIRKGQRATLELTPEKRPETPTISVQAAPLNQTPETNAPREQIRVVRPGMILPETTDSPNPPAPAAEE